MGAKLREHQEEARTIARKIVNAGAEWPHRVTSAYVTPGGGKTLLASVFAHELVGGDVVDYVLYVCPNDTLRTQVKKGFTRPDLGLGSTLVPVIGRPSGQRSIMREERLGFVTTYQSLATHPAAFVKLMSKDRWLLVLDECHHLPEPSGSFDDETDKKEAGWSEKARPVVAAAKHVLAMSGTMVRRTGRIDFIRYDGPKPVFDIVHTRRSALAAHTVINVLTWLCDGTSRYWHRLTAHETRLSVAAKAESARALSTALDDGVYRDNMLSEAIVQWQDYRARHNDRSRMIVICKDVVTCRTVCRYVADHHGKGLAVLAVGKKIGDEMSGAETIRNFREHREGKILVTCQMAYEGLDVPDCTHLVCLTDFRTRCWLEQAFSRVTRFDDKSELLWEQQCAYIFAPQDVAMVDFLSEWVDEQDPTFVEPKPRVARIGVTGRRSTFRPEGCEPGDVAYANTDGMLSDEHQGLIRRFQDTFPEECRSLRPDQWLSMALKLWAQKTGTDA